MRYAFLVPFSLAALSAQTALALPRLLQPNFPLLLAFAWGLAFGPAQGLFACALNGILLDTVSAAPFGSHLLAMTAASVPTLLNVQSLFERRLAESLVLVPLATLIYYAVLTLAFVVTGRTIDWVGLLLWVWTPNLLANVVWSFPILWLSGELAILLGRLPVGGIRSRPVTRGT